MAPKEKQDLDQHVQAIARLLYKDADPRWMKDLGGIEEVIREQLQEHVSPQIGVLFIGSVTKTAAGYQRRLKSILGNLPISSQSAEMLGVGKENPKMWR